MSNFILIGAMVHKILTKMQKKQKNVLFKPVALYMYSASGLKSKLFVFSVLWHILLSISSIKCHKRARFGENVAELLLIPYILCIEHESRYHIYSILYTRFFRQSAKSL